MRVVLLACLLALVPLAAIISPRVAKLLLRDVPSSRVISALMHLVGHFGVLLEGFEQAARRHVRRAYEEVPPSVIGGDEAVAALNVEPLDRSQSHVPEPAFLSLGSIATKAAPFAGRRFTECVTHLCMSSYYTTIR